MERESNPKFHFDTGKVLLFSTPKRLSKRSEEEDIFLCRKGGRMPEVYSSLPVCDYPIRRPVLGSRMTTPTTKSRSARRFPQQTYQPWISWQHVSQMQITFFATGSVGVFRHYVIWEA